MADIRRPAVFFRPFAVACHLWAGNRGEGLRPAGSHVRRFANPAFCPPTPFGDGARVQPAHGGRYGPSFARPFWTNCVPRSYPGFRCRWHAFRRTMAGVHRA
ncbi:hypothetical protein D0849_08725 [Bordetella avium]|nr:hypothetical protein D0849_08725 [Bordetella avium]